MTYDDLLDISEASGCIVREGPLEHSDGLIAGNRILIRKDLTTTEKACVLAEELAHHELTVGDILDQDDVSNRRQERRARIASYDRLIGLDGIVRVCEQNAQSRAEAAELLGVSEEFLTEAVDYYHEKYGQYARLGQYAILFEPKLRMMKIFK